MATYNVNLTNGSPLVSIPDGADRFISYSGNAVANIDPATLAPNPNSNVSSNAAGSGLRLLGQNSIDYGLKADENFVHILENFASNNQPNAALRGQLWYDTSANTLKVCSVASNYAANLQGTFVDVGGGGPQGLQGYVQYNSGVGSFAGSTNFVYDSAESTLSITGNIALTNNLRVISNSYSTSVRGNSTQSANLVFVLPPTAGSNNQTLTTDGQGNTYWSSAGTDRIIDSTGNTSIIASATRLSLKAGNTDIGNITDVLYNFTTNLAVTGNITAGGNITSNATVNANFLSVSNTANFSGNVSFTGSNVSLGANSAVRITGGTTGQVLSTDGAGNLSWATIATSGLSNGTSSIQVNATNVEVTAQGILTTRTLVANSIGVFAVLPNALADLPNTNIGNLNGLNLSGGNADSYLATDGAGNLRWQDAGAVTSISNGTSTIGFTAADGPAIVTINGNSVANFNAAGLIASNLEANGNITATGINIANGLIGTLVGTVTTTGNIDVANGNVVLDATGNITASSSIIIGNAVSNNITITPDDIFANTSNLIANAANIQILTVNTNATFSSTTTINSNGISTLAINANVSGNTFIFDDNGANFNTSAEFLVNSSDFTANIAGNVEFTASETFTVSANSVANIAAVDNGTITLDAANIIVANVANANGNVSLTMSEANSGTFTANADGNAFFSLRANTPLASLSVPTGNISLTSNNITLTGRTTIGNLQATITANADTPSGNLVTLTINGATYQLLAL